MPPCLATKLIHDVYDFLTSDCFGGFINANCEDYYESGGKGATTSTVNMGKKSGRFHLVYDMYYISDEIEVFYEDKRIHWSGGLVKGYHEVDLEYSGDSQLITVRVNAPNVGTTCPTP